MCLLASWAPGTSNCITFESQRIGDASFNEPRDDKPTDSGSSQKKREGKKKRRIKKIIYYDSDASSSSPHDDDFYSGGPNSSSDDLRADAAARMKRPQSSGTQM